MQSNTDTVVDILSLSDLSYEADKKLFRKMMSSNHCIHRLLPATKVLPMKLRSTSCVFALSHCQFAVKICTNLFCPYGCIWWCISVLFLNSDILVYDCLCSDDVCLLINKGDVPFRFSSFVPTNNVCSTRLETGSTFSKLHQELQQEFLTLPKLQGPQKTKNRMVWLSK